VTEPRTSQATPERVKKTRLKGPNGKFIASDETAQLDAYAARLRRRSMTYEAIGLEMGEDESTVRGRVLRCLDAVRREPAAALVALELDKLDAIEREALAVLETFHYVVSDGRVVSYAQTEGAEPTPLKDSGPVLAALDRLLKTSDARRKLLGLDAASKVDVSGGVTYTFENVSSEEL
jgi:hypothetical protein